MTAARYRVRQTERRGQAGASGAYYAANPAQHWTAHFTPEELALAPQPQAATRQAVPAWRLGMRLAGYVYGEQIIALGEGKLQARENRIDSQRPVVGQAGVAATEWYVNQAEGLEQGFTLHQPPAVTGTGEKLRLEVRGDLRAELAADQQQVWLKRSDGGVALRYGGLVAWDASGRKLGARMEVAGETVWLEVEEAGASYPVTIDPIFVEQQKLTASDGAAGDFFGISVALSGATLVVGAFGDDSLRGAAYVFAP